MLRILNQLKTEICPVCSVGNPVQILGYKASGSCMDYVFEKFEIPYSIAWEIYTNEKQFKELNNYVKSKRNDQNKTNNSKNSRHNKAKIKSNFLESSTQVYLKAQSYRRLLKARDFSETENKMCFKLFNPDNKDSYDFILETWRKVYLKYLFFYKKGFKAKINF